MGQASLIDIPIFLPISDVEGKAAGIKKTDSKTNDLSFDNILKTFKELKADLTSDGKTTKKLNRLSNLNLTFSNDASEAQSEKPIKMIKLPKGAARIDGEGNLRISIEAIWSQLRKMKQEGNDSSDENAIIAALLSGKGLTGQLVDSEENTSPEKNTQNSAQDVIPENKVVQSKSPNISTDNSLIKQLKNNVQIPLTNADIKEPNLKNTNSKETIQDISQIPKNIAGKTALINKPPEILWNSETAQKLINIIKNENPAQNAEKTKTLLTESAIHEVKKPDTSSFSDEKINKANGEKQETKTKEFFFATEKKDQKDVKNTQQHEISKDTLKNTQQHEISKDTSKNAQHHEIKAKNIELNNQKIEIKAEENPKAERVSIKDIPKEVSHGKEIKRQPNTDSKSFNPSSAEENFRVKEFLSKESEIISSSKEGEKISSNNSDSKVSSSKEVQQDKTNNTIHFTKISDGVLKTKEQKNVSSLENQPRVIPKTVQPEVKNIDLSHFQAKDSGTGEIKGNILPANQSDKVLPNTDETKIYLITRSDDGSKENKFMLLVDPEDLPKSEINKNQLLILFSSVKPVVDKMKAENSQVEVDSSKTVNLKQTDVVATNKTEEKDTTKDEKDKSFDLKDQKRSMGRTPLVTESGLQLSRSLENSDTKIQTQMKVQLEQTVLNNMNDSRVVQTPPPQVEEMVSTQKPMPETPVNVTSTESNNTTSKVENSLPPSSMAKVYSEQIQKYQETSAQQIVRAVHGSLGTGRSHINIRLVPESLGTLTVQLKMNAGVLSAHITAQNERTHAMLEKGLSTLRAAFDEQGIKVDRLAIVKETTDMKQHTDSNKEDRSGRSGKSNSENSSRFGQNSRENDQQQRQNWFAHWRDQLSTMDYFM